jgi:hypothetical protein
LDFIIPNLKKLNTRHSCVLFREFPFVLIPAWRWDTAVVIVSRMIIVVYRWVSVVGTVTGLVIIQSWVSVVDTVIGLIIAV